MQSYFDRRNFIIQRLKAILKTFYKNLNYLCKMINLQLKIPTLLILLMLVMGKIWKGTVVHKRHFWSSWHFRKFATFLTVARKIKYHCVYISPTIHPEKSVLKLILSKTNILNIFPASLALTSVKNMLGANCVW